jgi:hypothetical protein
VHATASNVGVDGTAGKNHGEENDLSRFKKMLLGAVAGMVLATGVIISPASASVPTQRYNQLDGNAPTLAWRGEHVRLGFCLPNGAALSTADAVTWSIEDWSGDPANGSIPVPFEITGARHFYNGCVYSEFSSQKAGVAFIKLSVNNSPTDETDPGGSLVTKQYMVAWMELQTPTVTGGGSVNAADFNCGNGLANTELRQLGLTDPYRSCLPDVAPAVVADPPVVPAVPADPTHLITANVKGIIPLLANFSEWGLGDHLTMPDDWAKWAAVAAKSSGYNSGVNVPDHTLADYMTNWDLHDDLTNVEGHVPGACDAPTNLPGSTDAVDNCPVTPAVILSVAPAVVTPVFGGTTGPFSTVFGQLSTDAAIGPYDMLYTYDTLLSNGTVDAGDAPMPAAQIDVDIAENSGAPTDTSGVGYLYPANKSVDDSRDGLGTDAAHNYDQPFYSQYIPATARPISATGSPYGAVQPTGITGTEGTGFNGFWWNSSDPYQNWEFAYQTSYHPNTASNCLEYRSLPGDTLHYRPLPYGPSSVTVYTDEHGNANVRYVPGMGYYFDNLGALKNVDGGCDLQGIDPIGSANVTVTARYPYQPVTAADPAAAPLHYIVHSLFSKTLAAYSKGPGAENANVRVVLAHAQDIDGSPLSHEVVCWSEQGAGYIHLFPTSSAGGTILDQNGATVAIINSLQAKQGYFIDPYSGRQCTTTDDNGNTAVEVGNSEGGSVDVMTEWMNEIVFRDIPVDFSTAPGTTGNLADSGPISHIPSPTQIKASTAAGSTIQVGPVLVDGKTVKTKVIKSTSKASKKAAHKIRTARVIKPFGGKRVLQVRVNGTKGMVALRITIKLGKTTHTFKRFVLANQKVAVKNLPIPVKTAKVTVSLLG